MTAACPLSVSVGSLRRVTSLRLASLVDPVEDRAPEHSRFLALLPSLRRQVRQAFRRLPAEARDEAVAEAVANAFVAYARLVELGKEDIAYPGPLARYAIAQVRSGRRVGTAQNVRDLLSEVRRHPVLRLDRFDRKKGEWREVVVEDRTCTPAEIAATRIDFADWLDSLTSRQRRMAEVLATGERTQAVAQRFRVTYSAVSEMRRRLREAWDRFQGEPVEPALVPV
jgi:DNA-binding CsgD family transcriptional regulator